MSEMRETLLGVVEAGAYDHTIAAFWQYIVYVEIILKIREMMLLSPEMTLPCKEVDFWRRHPP